MVSRTVLGLSMAAGALAAGAIKPRQNCSPSDSTCCAYYDMCDGSNSDLAAYYSEFAQYSDQYYNELTSELAYLTSLYDEPYLTDVPNFQPTDLTNPAAIISQESAYLSSIGLANPTVSNDLNGIFSAISTPVQTAGPTGGSSGGNPVETNSPAGSTPTPGNAPHNPLGGSMAADLRVPTMASLLVGGLVVAVALL